MEPALLSLFCRELNEDERGAGSPVRRAAGRRRQARHPVSNYYSSCVRDLPPGVAEFIESELSPRRVSRQLRPGGRRAVALTDDQLGRQSARGFCGSRNTTVPNGSN